MLDAAHRVDARLRLVLGVLFAVTGAVGLLLEQSLEKLISTVVGASTPAAAVVLAVYFSGIAAGGGLYALYAIRVSRPILVYASSKLAWAPGRCSCVCSSIPYRRSPRRWCKARGTRRSRCCSRASPSPVAGSCLRPSRRARRFQPSSAPWAGCRRLVIWLASDPAARGLALRRVLASFRFGGAMLLYAPAARAWPVHELRTVEVTPFMYDSTCCRLVELAHWGREDLHFEALGLWLAVAPLCRALS